MTADPNLSISSELASGVILNATVNCHYVDHNKTGGFFLVRMGFRGMGSPVWQNDIYRTNIPGIGMKLTLRVRYVALRNGGQQVLEDCTQTLFNQECGWGGDNGNQIGDDGYKKIFITIIATYLKIGDMSTEPQGPIAVNDLQLELTNAASGYPTAYYPVAMFDTTGVATNIIAPTCTLTKTQYNITLPPVSSTQLLAMGATAGSTDFTLELSQCAKGSNIYATFHDLNDTGDGQNGILGNTGTASGVAIQLLNQPWQLQSYQPLVLDQKTLLFRTRSTVCDNCSVSLPFQARYYHLTKGQVNGTVNSLANFTISYD